MTGGDKAARGRHESGKRSRGETCICSTSFQESVQEHQALMQRQPVKDEAYQGAQTGHMVTEHGGAHGDRSPPSQYRRRPQRGNTARRAELSPVLQKFPFYIN